MTKHPWNGHCGVTLPIFTTWRFASAICCGRVTVRLSVRPSVSSSVTSQYCIINAKHRITWTKPMDWIGNCTWLVISTVFSKMTEFSRSQPVTYTVNMVVSGKKCKIETFLLQTTNRKVYSDTSDDLKWPSGSFSCRCLSNAIVHTVLHYLTIFKLKRSSRGLIAIAELLLDSPNSSR